MYRAILRRLGRLGRAIRAGVLAGVLATASCLSGGCEALYEPCTIVTSQPRCSSGMRPNPEAEQEHCVQDECVHSRVPGCIPLCVPE